MAWLTTVDAAATTPPQNAPNRIPLARCIIKDADPSIFPVRKSLAVIWRRTAVVINTDSAQNPGNGLCENHATELTATAASPTPNTYAWIFDGRFIEVEVGRDPTSFR